MNKRLFNQQNLTRRLRLLSVLCAMLLMPFSAWAQDESPTSYDITVAGIPVTSQNASNITGDNIEAYTAGEPYSVSYDAASNTLSLMNARIASGGISSTSAAALNVALNNSVVLGGTGINGISCAGDLSISAVGTGIVFYPVVSTKAGGATLTLRNGSNADAQLTLNYQGSESGFNAVVYDGLYLSADNPRTLKFSASRQRFEDSEGAWASTIKFSNAKTYELWLGGTKVTESNKDNILGDWGSATFDPDENLLTLNGMTLTGTGITTDGIISRLPNLTISVNGANTITCMDTCSVIRADMEGEQTLTIQKGSDGCSLTLDGSRVIRDFNTFTATGLSWNDSFTYKYDETLTSFSAGYRLMKADGEEASRNYDTGFKPALYDSSVTPYDLWVAGVQVTSANAEDICGRYIDGTVSFDAANNVLTLERTTINLENVFNGIAVASGIADLTINLVGDNSVTPHVNTPFFAMYTGEIGATVPTLTFNTDYYLDDGLYWLGTLKFNGIVEIGSLTSGYEFTLEESPESVDPENAGSATTGWKYSVGTTTSYVKVWKLEAFDLWLDGNRVLSSDLGAGLSNGPKYNPVTERLVLSKNMVTDVPVMSSMAELTVEINGACSITPESSSPAIYFQEKGEVTSGSLTFVRGDDAVTASLTLTANGENGSSESYKAIEGYSASNIHFGEDLALTSHTTMTEALAATTVTIGGETYYNLKVGGVYVSQANAGDVLGDGTVTFTESGGQETVPTYTLTLNDATLTQPVIIGLPNLTIDIQGTNSITTTEPCIQKIENTDPSVTFKSTSTPVGSLILTNASGSGISEIGEDNISVSKELAVLLTVYGTEDYTSRLYYITDGSTTVAKIVPGYGVSMGKGGGDRLDIYEGNAADVFGDGTVSFNKNTNTLTLNGANKGDLSTSLSELTVELVGDNTLTEGSSPVLRSLSGDNVTINIQSTADVTGTLTMNMAYTQAGKFCEDQVTLNIIPPLALVSGSLTGNKDNKNTVVIDQIRNMGLTVSGVVVTNANAANVLGDGKVIYANGMLMLNGATLESGITSDMDQLKIVLAGTNSIAGTIAGTGTLYFATDDTDAKLTFTTESASAVSGFTEVTYLNGLRMKPTTGGFEVLIPSDYNLMVNGISVTPGNRKDVFGDGGSVIYDGEYTLILTNATLTQKIVLGSENTLDNLYIHLAGQNNTITSDDNVIVATAKPNMELHFVTNGNSPGKLVYTSTNASNPTLEGAFTGFSKVSFDNELEAILSGKTITLAQKIEPIINSDATSGKGSTANVDFTNPSPEMEQYNTSGANLNNMIVGDILFTLNDDGTKESPDGYDGSNVVINSEVSDEDLAAAMNLEPGSDAFAKKFNGLTFKLPASTGTIFIEARSLNGHQMCVKIGDQTATYITLTSTPTTYNVDYTCSTDTYVYIYLPQSSSSSAPRHVRGRIGPKSGVSGGLGNISVSSNSMVSAASSQPASNYMLLDRMAADAIISSVIPGEGLAFNDASITDLEDDMFLTGGGASSAPRRAAAPALKISSDLPFIDMRGTSIKNMEVSRSSGPFNGVPENVFIYMPAGNTTSEKNVVIGDVCDRMELKAELPGSGENEAKPFKVSKNFTAAQATLMRTFAEGGDESKATIYLPYAIPQEDANLLGQFFEFDGIDGGVVKMTKVISGGLKANKPYIFQAKAGGVVNPEVKIVTVQGMPGETEGFKGVYEQTTCGGDNWYGYAAEEVDGATIGQFVKLGSGASIAPFRAYMVADGNAPSYAIRWGGVDEGTTAIEEAEVQIVNERKPVEGWYTLTGARLVGQPTKPGLYIYNGRTVVVK